MPRLLLGSCRIALFATGTAQAAQQLGQRSADMLIKRSEDRTLSERTAGLVYGAGADRPFAHSH